MKFTTQRIDLLHACQSVAPASASKTTKPILSCLKIVAEGDGRIVVMATDLEIGMRHECSGAKVDRPGEVIVTQKFVKMMQESASPTVTLNSDDQRPITVRFDDARYELSYQDPSQFPDPPQVDTATAPHYLAKAADLKRSIARTLFAAEKRENSRYAVVSVLFELQPEDKSRMVATDTKRLSVDQFSARAVNGAAKVNGLIPPKAVSLLDRSMHLDEEEVAIALESNSCTFRLDKTTIYTRIVEGKFPPYQQFIPKATPVKVEVDAAEFATRVRQASIMSDEEASRVDIEFSDGKVTMKSQGQDIGSSVVEMPVAYSGAAVGFSVDCKFLGEAMRASQGKTTVKMTNPVDRIILNSEDGNWLHLLVPMIG